MLAPSHRERVRTEHPHGDQCHDWPRTHRALSARGDHARIGQYPHSTHLVCKGSIDQVGGYVDSKHLLSRVLNSLPISLKADGPINKVLIVPDRPIPDVMHAFDLWDLPLQDD